MQTPTSIMLKHLIFWVFDQKSGIIWLIGPLGVKVEGLEVRGLGLQQGNKGRKVELVLIPLQRIGGYFGGLGSTIENGVVK